MIAATRDYISEVWDAWTEFWFAPTSPTTLSAIRVLAGLMLFYTHLVWSRGLTQFFGENGWLPTSLMQQIHNFDPDGSGPLPAWSSRVPGLSRHVQRTCEMLRAPL